jgi:MFS family permease
VSGWIAPITPEPGRVFTDSVINNVPFDVLLHTNRVRRLRIPETASVARGRMGGMSEIAATSRLASLVPTEPALRRLAVVTLVNTFGNGLFMTLSALYFTRIVGLSVAQVGLGLTTAGALGVVSGVPFGQLADRIGARPLLVALVLAEAISTACYALIGSFAAFLVVASVSTVADRSSSAVRNGLFAFVLRPERRTAGRAYLRAVTNVGIGAGSAMAAVALQADTRTAYIALILVDVGTFVIAAALLMTVPVPPRTRIVDSAGVPASRNPALRDRPYLVVTVLNAVLALQFGIIEVGIPLWIVGHTDAPRAMVSVSLVINTILVVVLQVRASRGITDVTSAARLSGRAGVLMAAACLVFAAAHGLQPWAAAAVLVIAMVVQTLSEVTSSAAGWALSYDLADPNRHGAYQGVFSSGFSLAAMLAPVLVALTALRYGVWGWVALGVLFTAAGLAMRPAVAWAERTHAARVPVPG